MQAQSNTLLLSLPWPVVRAFVLCVTAVYTHSHTVSEQNMVNGGDPLMQSPNIMYQQPMGGSPLPPQLSDNPQLPQPGTGTITTSGGSFPLPPTPTSSVDLDKKTVQTKLMSPTSVPASQPLSSTAPSQPLPIEPKAEIKTEIKTEQVSSTPSVATGRNPLPSTTDGSVDMGHSEPLPSVSAAPTPQVPSGTQCSFLFWDYYPLNDLPLSLSPFFPLSI